MNTDSVKLFNEESATSPAADSGRERRLANLVPINKQPGVERGPDGRMRRKQLPPPTVRVPEEDQGWPEALDWVMGHLGQDVPTVPSNRALQLWLDPEKDPDAFRKQYLPMLIRGRPHPSSGESAWDGKSRCPVCKREPVGQDDGTQQAIKQVEKWLKGKTSCPADQGKPDQVCSG